MKHFKKILATLLTFALLCSLSMPAFAADSAPIPEETVGDELFDDLIWLTDNPLEDFSPDTKEWLEWFNSLPEEVQLTINYRPSELLNLKDIDPADLVEVQQHDGDGSGESVGIVPYNQPLMATGGGELSYSPSTWEPYTEYTNCYNYAINYYYNRGDPLQPGELARKPYTSLSKSDIFAAAKADMPYLGKTIRASSYSEVPGENEYKVALVIAPNKDYHWYRQDSDGRWSHKRGITAITNLDASDDKIYDPQTADRDYRFLFIFGPNYSTFCGYYIINYG